MFLIWVEKDRLREARSPGLLVSRADDLSFRLPAKEVRFPGGCILRQAYQGEPAPVPSIRAWIEAEGPIVVDGRKIV